MTRSISSEGNFNITPLTWQYSSPMSTPLWVLAISKESTDQVEKIVQFVIRNTELLPVVVHFSDMTTRERHGKLTWAELSGCVCWCSGACVWGEVASSCYDFSCFCDVVISLAWMFGLTSDCERTTVCGFTYVLESYYLKCPKPNVFSGFILISSIQEYNTTTFLGSWNKL